MILELSDQDNVALEEISKILERHPDLKLIEMVVEPTLIFNHLIIDTGKRKVYYNQQEVLLTTKEYELWGYCHLDIKAVVNEYKNEILGWLNPSL